MIHRALGFHGPMLKFTGWNQENKAVTLKMLPQGPYLGERTQAKKYLIIKQLPPAETAKGASIQIYAVF